ncbi:hypothetical protein ACTS9U_16745 [Empedobacter falsenii]
MKAIISYEQFEKIVLNPEKYHDWNNIFKHHIDIDLNIEQKYIEELELDTTSVLFHFINITGGKFCNTYNSELDFEKEPSKVFFEEKVYQPNNGYLLIDNETLENPFKLSYGKSFEKNDSVNIANKKGWKAVFNNKNLDSNALIINDSYIFDDKENQTKVGSKNIIQLLDAILPNQLKVEYHILINTTTSKNKTNTFYDSFVPDLIEKITQLRSYKIIVEIIIGEGFHKRKLFTNFLNVTTDKGFKLFDARDSIKVLDHNDVTIETMFTRNDPNQGDSQYDEMKIRMKELRKLIKSSLDWINTETYNNTRSFYYSNLEKQEKIEIINRLNNEII